MQCCHAALSLDPRKAPPSTHKRTAQYTPYGQADKVVPTVLERLARILPENSQSRVIGRLIGVDYGRRRIGLAIGDAGVGIASPAEVLAGRGDPAVDAESVARYAAAQQAAGIVVGLPLNMDGTRGPQAKLTQAFAAALRTRTACVVVLWDERLSSFQADAHLSAAGVGGLRRQRLRDAIAAQVILQSYLDSVRGGEEAGSGESSPG